MKDFTCAYCGEKTSIEDLLKESEVDYEMVDCEVDNYNPFNKQFTVANVIHCPKCERRFMLYAIHKLDVIEINDEEDLAYIVYQEKADEEHAVKEE